MNITHDRIEAIAGAIALGEATDNQRTEYREHIATCARCLNAFGGEREIERVAETVGAARESEMWDPALGDVVRTRLNQRARKFRYIFSTLAACLLVAVGVRVAIADGALHLFRSSNPVVINAGTTRIVLEQREAMAKPLPEQPTRRLIVTHNVVQIARAPLEAPPVLVAPKVQSKPQQITAVTVHPDAVPAQQPVKSAPRSNIPVWRSDVPIWRTIAKTTTTSLSETAPQPFTHAAESIQVSASIVRDAMPIGGETAINPQPPMSAYDEDAQGTALFEVHIDESGNPTKCIITSSTGYDSLDAAVCRAAMRARYSPKTIGGRPVPGIYRDAFTFRMTDKN